MKFAAAAGRVEDFDRSVNQLCDQAREQLGDARVDLAFAFLTSHFEEEAAGLAASVGKRFPSAVFLGVSGEGVVGTGAEYERMPALSLMLAAMPEVRLTPYRMSGADLAGLTPSDPWVQRVGVPPDDLPSFVFFGDPFTVPIQAVLANFNRSYPGRPLFGGMASGCENPGQAVLILNDQVHRDGAVGVALSGPVEICGVVSQGCRPIGDPLVITKAQRNIIFELGGKPALEQLRRVISSLPPEEEQLARQALFVGRVINEYQEQFQRGDFLIRNLMGFDPQGGALMIGDDARVGATIQFHVRDSDSADEDLKAMLAGHGGEASPVGALLFSCNGRGQRMWDQPHHDAGVFQQLCGEVPLSGFFAAGELGPIGGTNFIHGHTASMLLFREQAADESGES